jgi:hypothetical protein
MTDGKGPRRGYSWPTAGPGNTIAETHGAYSTRRVDPRAAEIVAELLALPELPQHLRRPEFGAAVAAWGRAEARVDLMEGWLSAMDTTKPGARLLSVLQALARAESAAARLRSELGLTPMSAARLGRDLSTSRYMLSQVTAGVDRLAAAGPAAVAADMRVIAEIAAAKATEAGPDE